MRRLSFVLLFLCAVNLIIGCGEQIEPEITGRPRGPYTLTLNLSPENPLPNELTQLTLRLTYAKSGKPVTDLQVAHERLIHNFITKLDFSNFSHIHHEDFFPVSEADKAAGTLRFPYRFPQAGNYRMVSEFAHRNRNWIKHFDIVVGKTKEQHIPVIAGLESRSGNYQGALTIGTAPLRAGRESELNLHISHKGEPVTDLALYLGTEMHGAVWRNDGKNFGHLHSFTPKVAAILALAHERDNNIANRGELIQQMMVQLMCLEAELVFEGPTIPIKYVFPAPGRYYLFLQVAPQGSPIVFKFAIDVG